MKSPVPSRGLGLLLRSGMFFFTGPLLLTFAMVFEWIMGNFFPMMVMGLFSVFWLSFGMLQLPTLSLGSAFATSSDPTGTTSPAFNAAIALYLVVWGFALLTFFFFTLKINIVFASIFGLVTAAAWILAGAYFKVSTQDFDTASKLQKVKCSPIIPPCLPHPYLSPRSLFSSFPHWISPPYFFTLCSQY